MQPVPRARNKTKLSPQPGTGQTYSGVSKSLRRSCYLFFFPSRGSGFGNDEFCPRGEKGLTVAPGRVESGRLLACIAPRGNIHCHPRLPSPGSSRLFRRVEERVCVIPFPHPGGRGGFDCDGTGSGRLVACVPAPTVDIAVVFNTAGFLHRVPVVRSAAPA